MEEFKVDQLTKELVTAKLRAMDDPCEAAAAIVQATLNVAFSAATDPKARVRIIEDACRGGMTGLLLVEQSTAKGAVMMLHRIVELSARHGLDPMAAMEGALKGFASLRRVMHPGRVQELYYAVQADFMGAGDMLLDDGVVGVEAAFA